MLGSNLKKDNNLVESKISNEQDANALQLEIASSTSLELKGKIQLEYLNEQFEGRFVATPELIKLKTIHPYQGMVAAVALDPGNKNLFLQQNGGFSAAGQQHLYFLVFDIFHLYNLFRLKPQALLGLYQQALAILKSKGATIEFGHIDPRSAIGLELAAWLHQQAKLQFKHSYCSPKGLLYSFQNLLKLYPEYFIAE